MLSEAFMYSLHSFKHLLVTAGRQLQIPEPAIDVMAGWAVKSSSGMPSIYDSVSASSELLYKDYIHSNIIQGWSLAVEGAIPKAPVVPFRLAQPAQQSSEGFTLVDRPVFTQRGGELQHRRMTDSPLNQDVVQCLNTNLGTVHLYIPGKFTWKDPKTVCGRWACGSPSRPASAACFAANSVEWTARSSQFAFCERCYGDCYPNERCLPSPKKQKPAAKDLVASSSSSSSSSSESE